MAAYNAQEFEDAFNGVFLVQPSATVRTLVWNLLERFPEEDRVTLMEEIQEDLAGLPAVMTIDSLEPKEQWRVESMLPREYQNAKEHFQFTQESLYSVTRASDRRVISGWIKGWLQKSGESNPKKLKITDATAHIGGDSIGFWTEGYSIVQSVELETLTYNVLLENLDLLGFDSAYAINADYTDVFDQLEQDIIFIDAPWGGPEVMSQKNVSLKLGDKDLNAFAEEILQKGLCRVLVLKVPPGYKIKKLSGELAKKYGQQVKDLRNQKKAVKYKVIGYFLK